MSGDQSATNGVSKNLLCKYFLSAEPGTASWSEPEIHSTWYPRSTDPLAPSSEKARSAPAKKI